MEAERGRLINLVEIGIKKGKPPILALPFSSNST
jgi:hypothetical protein